jgi:uncharacterized protein
VPRVLVVGVATRGLAESAARAGYDVVAIDGFGDLDLRACAREVVVTRSRSGFDVARALRAAGELTYDAACYVGSLENHPAAVQALAERGRLWGNPADVLTRARDPVRLAGALRARGFAAPAVCLGAPRAETECLWLTKPRASGGGAGIAPWRAGRRIPRGRYLQERIVGIPGSLVFAADGRRVVPLGLSRALAGDRRFGAHGFRYCGSILAPPRDPLLAAASRLAAAVTEECGLVGVNGLDFVTRGGVPYPIEVNPRYTASMELVERAYGVSIFELHARACEGELRGFRASATARSPTTIGKAILYARQRVIPRDTEAWLARDDIRDVPIAGEPIAAGHPICTIFARGRDPVTCYAALVDRARRLYRTLAETRVRVA